jgi:hypothetical protein
MGLFQAPNNSGVLGALPRGRLGVGGGLLATARSAGMVLGMEAAGALFALRAGQGTDQAGFLPGFALALRAGAALAMAAGALSLAGGPTGGPTPPGRAAPPP